MDSSVVPADWLLCHIRSYLFFTFNFYIFQPARVGPALLEGPDLPAPPKHKTPRGQHSEAVSAHTTRRGRAILLLGESTAHVQGCLMCHFCQTDRDMRRHTIE